MIDIIIQDDQLLLYYLAENSRPDWVHRKIEEDGQVTLAKTFTFSENDVIENPQDDDIETEDHEIETDDEWKEFTVKETDITFLLGTSDGEYFRIKDDILGLQHDLLLPKENMTLTKKTFIATRNMSIFAKIDRLTKEQIIIGGSHENAIPISEFQKLLKTFPTTTELNHYASSRISLILKEYLGTMTDAQKKLDDYLKKKQIFNDSEKIPALYEQETYKYEFIRDEIKGMLSNTANYSESEWQDKMLKFLLLIFPKYITVLENVAIEDSYSKKGKTTRRYIDLSLIDANGNLDVIEIKKPFDSCLLSSGKYRDNYTPKKELSGAVMQAEKYLFHLNKWGALGEKKLTEKHSKKLPSDMEIRITNPKAMIIIGRSHGFKEDEIFDFEIIKRKYANIIDIITYDDLLQRLENIINRLKAK